MRRAVGTRSRPRKLLRALLLQAFYSVRSERQLMQQITYNMLFRWFVGLSMDAAVWDVTVFTKNRDRLLAGDIAQRFFAAVLADPAVEPLLSSEHFSVDGTLLEAWASMKAFGPRTAAANRPARGATASGTSGPRSAATRRMRAPPTRTRGWRANPTVRRRGSATPGTWSWRTATGWWWRPAPHATGTAERDAAQAMLAALAGTERITLGADKNYDTQAFVAAMRKLRVTPHVAQNVSGRRSAIDGRTTRHAGYAISQCVRKRIEEVFGWGKEVAGMRRLRLRGLARVGWAFTLRAAAYNLVRLPKLLPAAA